MKRTPLRKVSKKRAKELKTYDFLRVAFLTSRKFCEIVGPHCTRKSTEIHHVNGRNSDRLLNTTWWTPACRSCHSFLHDNPKYARDAGFLI